MFFRKIYGCVNVGSPKKPDYRVSFIKASGGSAKVLTLKQAYRLIESAHPLIRDDERQDFSKAILQTSSKASAIRKPDLN